MSFKFGLNIKNKALNGPNKPVPGKRKPFFDEEEDDDGEKTKAKAPDGTEEIAELTFDESAVLASRPSKLIPSSRPKGQPTAPPSRPVQTRKEDPTTFGNAASIREAEQRAQEAAALDPTIYDYDAAYEALNARKLAKKAAEQEEVAQGRPKYMETLLESAEVRKKDRLRARDKLLQREREAEGDDFADKAKFVTSAYKAQQEEARQAEEEEKKRQEIEEEKRRKEGMKGFHRQVLLEGEQRHREAEAAMAEAADMAKKGIKPVTIEEPKEKSEVDIAKELNAQGKNIIINDEGQVADKRQLLSAGLNVVAKPKIAKTTSSTSVRPGGQTSYQGRNTGKGAFRLRQTEMIAQQIEQAAKRKADEEAEAQRNLEHTSKSRKTEADISSAKERYLQRKREAAAAKAASGK
jgi:hypothetical protein